MRKFLIEEKDNGKRLDLYLTNTIDVSRHQVHKQIKEGGILVNDETKKPGYTLKEKDQVIIITEPGIAEISLEPTPMDLDIVFENNDLMIINKPSGLVVHPAPTYLKNTLVNGLLALNIPLSDLNGELRPGIVHRLDKDTSGVLIIAKNNKIHEYLKELMQKQLITRKYQALVHGTVKYDTGTIDAPIGRSNTDRKKFMVTNQNAKPALTHFKVLTRYQNYTLLECELVTGRTHQIRVHLEYIGHPIVGDPVYSNRKNDKQKKYGQFLHATSLEFKLPHETINIETKLPAYFENFLTDLEEYHD